MGQNPSRYATVVNLANATGTLPIANGGTGQATNPLPTDMPADHAMLAWNMDPASCNTTVNPITAGTVYLARINIRTALTATNIVLACSNAGNNTGGSTGTFVGLYSSAGTLLSGSADVATSLLASGGKVLALTTPQALSAGTFVWAALLVNLGTTQPGLAKTGATTQVMNINLAAAQFYQAVNGTVQTSLPSPIIPANNTVTGSQGLFMGIS